jgi:hypothetical protein
VTNALKEARLQKLVLTNRNDIRGMKERMSIHTNTKFKGCNRTQLHFKDDFFYVDVAGIDGKKMLLPEEVLE